MFTEDYLGIQVNAPVRMYELQLNFNASTGFGETLECCGSLDEGGNFYVAGTQENGKNAFQAQGFCKKIVPENLI